MSSTYRQYQEARDTAWRALLRLENKRLPVEPDELAALLGVEIHPFPDPKENNRLWTLANQVRGVCVSLRVRGAWHMFVRDGVLDAAQRRFAVAHELGHLLLGAKTKALAPGVRCFESGDNQGDLIEDPQTADYAADIFAIRLLAPACLLHELGVDTPDGIMALCGLPPRAAALRAERMELLNQRNAFYANPLERQVRDTFRPFLLSRMTPSPPKRAAVPLALPERKRPEPQAPRRRFSLGFWQRRALWALLALAALALLFLLGKGG